MRAMHGTIIGGNEDLRTPEVSQNVCYEEGILTSEVDFIQPPGLRRSTRERAWLGKSVNVPIQVRRCISELLVGAHDGRRSTFFERDLIGGEKHFMQSLVLDVSKIAVRTVVDSEVFTLRHETLALDAVDLGR